MKKNLLIPGLWISFLFLQVPVLAIENDSLRIALSKEWLGYWKGDLKIYNSQGKSSEIKMEMKIKATGDDNKWEWSLIYLPKDKRDERNYELKAVNSRKGKYSIDEKNSIILEVNEINGILVSRFSVGDSDLLVVYRLENKEMMVEFFFSSQKSKQQTGSGNEQAPLVFTYTLSNYQVAKLRKDLP